MSEARVDDRAEGHRSEALSRELWEAFAQSPLSTVVYDADGRILAVNAAFERLWGIGAADIPASYSVLTDPQLAAGGLVPLLRRAFGADGAGEPVQLPPVRYEVDRVMREPNGGRVTWTQAHAYPVRDGDGRVHRVVLTHLDVSERVERELALQQANDEASSQRDRLARVVAQSPVAMGVLEGREHVFVAVSEAYQRMAPGVELIGRRNRDAFPELVDQGFVALLDRVFESGVPFVGRDVPARWDSRGEGSVEEHLVDFVYQPFRSATGDIEGIVFTVTDVTERSRAEQALRESEAFVRASEARQRFLLALSDRLRGLDDADTIRGAAARALGEHLGANRVGYAEIEPDGMHATVRSHHVHGVPQVDGRYRVGDYSPTLLATLRAGHPIVRDDVAAATDLTEAEKAGHAALQIGAVADFPYTRGGELRAILFMHRREPHRWSEEEIALLGAVAERTWDAVDRARAEGDRVRALQASEQARAEAEAANRAKGEFLAVMSHELRTPLNAIGGYAELMELGVHGPVTDPQRTALGRIQASQRHLLGLINEVLNYARIDAGAVQYDLTDVHVAEALVAAESLVRPQADARHLALLRVDVPPDARVRADREKLQQILLNLISNAIKFTEPGGTIALSCAVHAAQVAITVTDSGIGIPARKLDTIFEPFVQVDQRLTRRQEGVGLGLAISRDLARGMGGDLVARSVEGEGSAFTLTLPRAHA